MRSLLSFRGKIFIEKVACTQFLKGMTSTVFCFSNNYRYMNLWAEFYLECELYDLLPLQFLLYIIMVLYNY